MWKELSGSTNAYHVVNMTKWKQERGNTNALGIVNYVMLVRVTDSRVKYIVANIKIKNRKALMLFLFYLSMIMNTLFYLFLTAIVAHTTRLEIIVVPNIKINRLCKPQTLSCGSGQKWLCFRWGHIPMANYEASFFCIFFLCAISFLSCSSYERITTSMYVE